jgi:hypothetical protein
MYNFFISGWRNKRGSHLRSEDPELERCIEQIVTDNDRYYYSVLVTIGFRDFVNKNTDLDLKFVSAERKMKDTTTQQNGRPDIIIQYVSTSEGILIEFKSSSPLNPSSFIYSIDDDIVQLQKYDNNLIGWDTKTGEVDTHVVVFLVHHEDYKKVKREIIENRIEKDTLSFKHTFSIWEWTPEISTKYGRNEQIRIRDPDDGKIGNKLGEYLKENDIVFPLIEIEEKYAEKQLKFIRKEPPTAYLIDIVLFMLLPKVNTISKSTVIVTIEKLMNIAEDYLPNWIPECSQKSQIKRGWIKKCLNKLKQIGIVTKISGDEYTIKIPDRKDLKHDIIKKLAKLELEKKKPEVTKRNVEENLIKTTTLDQF